MSQNKMTVDSDKMNRLIEAVNSLIEDVRYAVDLFDDGDNNITLNDLYENSKDVKDQMESLFRFDENSMQWVVN